MEQAVGRDELISSGTEYPSRGRMTRVKRGDDADHEEVEWRFDADDLEHVGGWLEEGAESLGIAVGPGEEKEIVDAYYDTGDLRLYRAGYALRVRKAGRRYEATMKSLVSTGDGSVHRRREISEPLRDGEVGALLRKKRLGPVGVRLRVLVGARELHPLFEIRTRRRTFDLLDGRFGSTEDSSREIVEDVSGDIRREGDSMRIGEVALDESEIPLGLGDEPVRLTRVEVEADASAASAPSGLLEDFAGAMEKKLGLQQATTSKYETGLLAMGLHPEEKSNLGPIAVDDSLAADEVAFRVLRREFIAMRAHEAGVRLDEDPEELHDMRVATRRARSALELFKETLPEEVYSFREELKFVAGVLGEVRDLDVQIERLERLATEADEKDLLPLQKITDTLEKRRTAARESLLEALDSKRYEHFEASFSDVLRRGLVSDCVSETDLGSPPSTAEPILVAAPDLISHVHRRWLKAAKRASDAPHPEELHDLRKKGKRFRYALEFLSDVYGKKIIGELVKQLKSLQDDLGRHQDLIVAADLLGGLVAEGNKIPSQTAFAMGALAERDLREAADLRVSLPDSKAYRKLVKGKVWKSFKKVIEKKQPSGVEAGSKKEK